MNEETNNVSIREQAWQKYRDEKLGGRLGTWDGWDRANWQAGYDAATAQRDEGFAEMLKRECGLMLPDPWRTKMIDRIDTIIQSEMRRA